MRQIIKVNKKFNNKSIIYILDFYGVSKHIIKSKLNAKAIFKNGNDVVDENTIFIEGDNIYIEEQPQHEVPNKKRIKVIYEDDNIIAVYKESYMLIHPDGNTSETLLNAVFNYLRQGNKEVFCYPVHRIDFETKGLVIFAKNMITLAYLSKQMMQGEITKMYQCVVHGNTNQNEFVINKPIGKDRHSNRQVITKNGKESATYCKVLKRIKNKTILEVKIVTGRKHQIRVHLSSVGLPIVGDKIYGIDDGNETMELYSCGFSFIDPITLNRREIKIQGEYNE